MKLKSVIVSIVFLFFLIGSMQAQGIYSKKTQDTEEVKKGGGAQKEEGNPGEDGGRPDGGVNADDEAPIGEGIVILSLLAGAYAFSLKKRNNKES
jgi:hypothetical protein